MMDLFFQYLLLILAGGIAGVLNVVAGGGSFLTLPILIFMGLPANIANGTNRVGILLQNIGAVWGFHRTKVMDWKSIFWAALPASLGAIVGTIIALSIGDATFQKVLAFLMVAVTLWTIWDPLGKSDRKSENGSPRLPILAFGFFLTGIYGGFVQAGVGFLVLAVTTVAGLDLVRGNAVKVLSILAFTIVSLALFAFQGKVFWHIGLVLGLGTFLGGQLGVRLTILKGHTWVKRVVTGTIVVFAVKLFIG